MESVTGPGQVAFTGLSVWVTRYLNSSTVPRPFGTVTFRVAR